MKHLLLPLFALLALTGSRVLAQTTPPVLNAPPTVPPAASPAPAATLPAGAPSDAPDTYLLGRVYRVETQQGTTFTGTLVSISLKALEFDANELGHITLERGQIRRANLQGPRSATVAAGKAGYYDIGNGNRLFFAPTARGLRKNEASLQDVNAYLLGINYGITDNLSLGGYMSILPGLSLDEQFFMFTPKLSYPINDRLHAGFGLLYIHIPDFGNSFGSGSGSNTNSGTGAGIGYGALTYGGADNNLTLGVGYAFVQGSIGSTPIIEVGGQTRVSRRVSLLSENYIVADNQGGVGGLYGVKLNWRRTSLGLAALYFYRNARNEVSTYPIYNQNGQQVGTGSQTYSNPSASFTSYVIPLYVDFNFRFGKGAVH